MRKNKVQLASLSVGRCFTLPVEPGAEPSPRPEGEANQARIATPVLAPERAWKIRSLDEDHADCASASGEERAFPLSTEVVEIPRQGFETLAAR